MGIGPELRDARVRAGLSVKQLADRTKLKLEKIEALEKSDFEHLPRGIYLRGVVKAYAQEVGVDAKLAVERLREEIPQADKPAWISEDASAGIPRKEGATKQAWPTIEPLAARSARSDAQIEARPSSAVVAAQPGPSARRRFDTGSLAFAVLAVLAAVGLGLYLRSVTRTIAVPRPNGGVETVAQSAATLAAAGGRRAGPAHDVPVRAVDRDARAAIAPAAPEARPEPVEPPPPAPISSTDMSGVSGTWDLTTQVESASTDSDRVRRAGYRIDFRQSGDQIRGSGYKTTENGEAVAAGARTPITLQGTIEGRELVLTFTERGALGTSNGRFVLILGADHALRGSFQSDAAKSRGSINARRRP